MTLKVKASSSTKEKSESENINLASMDEGRNDFKSSFASFIKSQEITKSQVDFSQQVDLKSLENMIIDRADVDSFIDDFVRLFRLSKRSIEYLIYTQNYLKSVTIALE